MTVRDAVIVDTLRTPIGKRKGALVAWHPADLLGSCGFAALRRRDHHRSAVRIEPASGAFCCARHLGRQLRPRGGVRCGVHDACTDGQQCRIQTGAAPARRREPVGWWHRPVQPGFYGRLRQSAIDADRSGPGPRCSVRGHPAGDRRLRGAKSSSCGGEHHQRPFRRRDPPHADQGHRRNADR